MLNIRPHIRIVFLLAGLMTFHFQSPLFAESDGAESSVAEHSESAHQPAKAPSKGSLILFRPAEENTDNTRDDALARSISAPAEPLQADDKLPSAPAIVDKLGRMSVSRDDEGDTVVQYQFKKKSDAARKADAREQGSATTDQSPKQLSIFSTDVEIQSNR